MLINKNMKTRTNKLTFNDALLYKFKCAFKNSYNKFYKREYRQYSSCIKLL